MLRLIRSSSVSYIRPTSYLFHNRFIYTRDGKFITLSEAVATDDPQILYPLLDEAQVNEPLKDAVLEALLWYDTFTVIQSYKPNLPIVIIVEDLEDNG